jgi:hypothetical protein
MAAVCAEPGCRRQSWTTFTGDEPLVQSRFCYEHSSLTLIDMPGLPPVQKTGPVRKARSRVPAAFRRHLARERERHG